MLLSRHLDSLRMIEPIQHRLSNKPLLCNIQVPEGETPLSFAFQAANLELCKFLVSRRRDVDEVIRIGHHGKVELELHSDEG